MLSVHDAYCVEARCGKNGEKFYILFYKAYDKKWVCAYGKKEIPQQTGKSSVGTVPFEVQWDRKGPQYCCPHCGNKHFFTCWKCGKRTCYDGDNHDGREVVCAHCHTSGVFRSSTKEDKEKDKKRDANKTNESSVLPLSGQV